MLKRPLYHNLMKNKVYFSQYREFNELISQYFESGYFERYMAETRNMIASYVKKDPTAFVPMKTFMWGWTFDRVCLLRTKSVRGQLNGTIPLPLPVKLKIRATLSTSSVWLPDMGEIADLKNKK